MKKQKTKRFLSKAKNLGDFVLEPFHFENLDQILKDFQKAEFKKLNHQQKSERVNRTLLDLILEAPEDAFLLIAVLEYIDQVFRKNLLLNYTFSSFEIWLNQFSGLSEEENYLVRAKIVGKKIPRDDYQILFPIGMGKIHPGSHYVTAHASPDLDTTIASFWGWVDALGARVGENLHIWNIPGGPPSSSIEIALLFHHIFGSNVFQHLAKKRTTLALSSLELMTQLGVMKQKTDQSSLLIDHERTQKAIILVDDNGYFLGDWRSFDVEGVRQVIMLLNHCLRWFENHVQIELISLFAKQALTLKDIPKFVKRVFEVKIKESDPAQEFTEKQKRHMDSFLRKILKIEKGLETTFTEFAKGLQKLNLNDFQACIEQVQGLNQSDLFDKKGSLIEDRPKIFHHLEKIIAKLDQAIQSIRLYIESLEVALNIKTQVFGYLPQVVSYRADVDELRSKMGNYPYLTVTSTNEEGQMLPLGIVRSRDLQKTILGTVSLRDFCNREETKVPSYFEVISVIDHHKTVLQTEAAPVVYISDAQSSNAIVAQLAFAINDKYSTGAMTEEAIEEQMKKVQKDLTTAANKRILQRLLKRLHATSMQKKDPNRYYIDPLREFVEYLHFLYAILDDTDLLTKVSQRDIECVVELLNRMKSLMEGKEVEIIHVDDLQRNGTFVQKAASRILQNSDMYSLYRKIYIAKEQLFEENLKLCISGKESSIFADVKLQNGCVRVGQTKMFANNLPSFQKQASKLRQIWVQQSNDFFADRREFDLHLQMMSTIAGAEDLFKGKEGNYSHKDELWIWIPMTDQSIEHLKGFLNAFRNSAQIVENEQNLEMEFLGSNAVELSKIFKESFLPIPQRISEKEKISMVILRYPAGTLNSRKAMISPYLPKVLS